VKKKKHRKWGGGVRRSTEIRGKRKRKKKNGLKGLVRKSLVTLASLEESI